MAAYKTSAALLTLPSAADGVSVTPSGVSDGWSAWVELSSSAPVSMRVASLLAYPGVRENGNFFEAEIGVGSAGNEAPVAATRGYSGDPNGGPADANDAVDLPLPCDVITAGDRIAVRLRQVSTTTTAWKFSIQYWARPITDLNMPVSAIGPVNVPSGSRLTVTSGASSSTFGAWVEVTAATDADWTLGNLAYFGPQSAEWTLEIGIGAASSEVTRWTVRSAEQSFFGGFQGGPYNILFRPLLGPVPSGSRLAIRVKSATTVSAFSFGFTVLKALVSGTYTATELNWYPDVTITSAAGGPTVFTDWTTIAAATSTDVGLAYVYRSSPQGGGVGQVTIQLGVGPAGAETLVAECYTRTSVWGGGQFTLNLPIARYVGQGRRIALRYATEDVTGGDSIAFGVGYHALGATPDFDNISTDLIQRAYLAANNPFSCTTGGSAWVNGGWQEIDASVEVDRVLTAWLWQSGEPFVEFELDVGTGTAGSETVAFTLRVGFGSSEGTLVNRMLPIPQTIAASSRLAIRGRSSFAGAVSIAAALHYTAEPVDITTNRNLLTGYTHTVTGSDNVLAGRNNTLVGQTSQAHGESMTVVGTRAIGYGLDGSSHTLNDDGLLKIFGRLSATGDVAFTDIAAAAAQTYGVVVDDTGLLASQALTPDVSNATFLTSTDESADLPNSRQVLDTANVEWDFGTVNEAEADLTDTAVTPGTYGDDTHVAQFTVDQKGRLTAASDVEIAFPSSSGGWVEGLLRTLGDGASTAFPLPDVAESILFASVAGAVTDPLTYTLTGSDDEITFDAAPGVGDVVTVNYVTASA